MGKTIIICVFFWMISVDSFSKNLVEVKIGSIVPLDMRDTEYSERYRVGYQGALFFAAGEINKNLSACGFRLSFDFKYYKETNPARAIEYAKSLEKSGVWLVLGPSRSDHYLVLVNSLKSSMAISPLASSSRVMELQAPFFTMYPPNSILAKSLKSEIERQKYGSNYGIIFDKGCLNCRSMGDEFKKAFGQPIFELNVDPDNLDFSQIFNRLKEYKIDFLFLPNYSKLSGTIISLVASKDKNIRYVGADGWGDGTYGYLTKIPIPNYVQGISIRLGGTSSNISENMGISSLVFRWGGKNLFPASSSLLMIEHMRKISEFLCEERPKNKIEFIHSIKKKDRDHFRSKIPLAIYTLNNGILGFSHEIHEIKEN